MIGNLPSGGWRIVACLACAWMAAVALPCVSEAAVVTLSVRVGDELRVADAEVLERQGVAYVSLPALVRQIGGACTVNDGRVQVDLMAKTAWLRLNALQVNASLGDFAIGHAILQEGADALIALSDVADLFDKAFFLALKQDLTTSPPPQEPPEPTPPPPMSDAPAETPPPQAPAPSAPAQPQRAVSRPIETVIIDPGHGGKDAGCEGKAGLKESALVLAVAQKVKADLEKTPLKTGAPLNVLMTRDTDRDLTRSERIMFANGNKGDLLVSLHAGGGLAPAGAGFEIFCCAPAGPEGNANPKQPPATRLGIPYAERSQAGASAIAVALAEATGAVSRGLHAVPCAVLADVPMPGLLIEIGYLTNPTEETALQNEAYQDKVAQGIAAGIRQCIEAGPGGGAAP